MKAPSMLLDTLRVDSKVLALVVLTICAVGAAWLLKKSNHASLPPGPPGLPVFGCLFSMPKTHLWLWFDKLFKRYGPLVSFKYANQTFIVIGNFELSQEILVKRAGRNSSRPPMYAFDLMSQGRRFIFLKDNDPGWRVSRKLLSQVMGEVRQGQSAKLSEFECKYTMQRILAAPEDWKAQFQRQLNLASYLSPSTIEHDPVRYPDPHTFKPQRHISAQGELKPDETTAFGFGRRACVGRPMAEKLIWVMVTTMMWLFDIARAEGDNSELDQFAETGSADAHPGTFRAVLRPKSAAHEAIARKDFEEYDKNLAHLVA